MYLCGAGIGHIGIVDFDEVELSNLHRQIGHVESSIGMKKVSSLELQLMAMNPLVKITPYDCLLNEQNALKVIREYDVVIDATDNITSRYLINDACVLMHKPLVYGSALGLEGQVTLFNHKGGPCYRCLFPMPSEKAATSCSEGGILGACTGECATDAIQFDALHIDLLTNLFSCPSVAISRRHWLTASARGHQSDPWLPKDPAWP